MPNFAQAVKAEIVRLSRKQVNASAGPLRSSLAEVKRAVADLKRKVALLEATSRRILALQKNIQEKQPPVPAEDLGKRRITSRSVRALRKKLGLSQGDFGRLLGVTRQSVLVMEKKQGRLKLRPATFSKLLALKEIGKREARQRLQELGDE
jgi:DNA-binding XRE family transcriptional regulator